MAQQDVLEDAGTITVVSETSTRTEAFETVRHEDGTRTTTSVITDRGGAFRVEGRWSYDADGRSTGAKGIGSHGGAPVDVEIAAHRPTATISINSRNGKRTITAPCGTSCFIDLSPSVMAMFSITRQFEADSIDARSYQWIGQALHRDMTLTQGGGSKVRLHAVKTLDGLTVLQFMFFETLPGAESSASSEAAFNLYVDADHRPLAFVANRGTMGLRAGYENIPQLIPPVFVE